MKITFEFASLILRAIYATGDYCEREDRPSWRLDKFYHRMESKVGRHNPTRNPFVARFILQPSWHNNGRCRFRFEHDPLHSADRLDKMVVERSSFSFWTRAINDCAI